MSRLARLYFFYGGFQFVIGNDRVLVLKRPAVTSAIDRFNMAEFAV